MFSASRGRGGSGPSFGSRIRPVEGKPRQQSQSAEGALGGITSSRGRGGGFSGSFGSNTKKVTFGDSVTINEFQEMQPIQQTDTANNITVPRGGMFSGHGRGRGGNVSNTFTNDNTKQSNEQPAVQEFGNGWDSNDDCGWGSVPTDAANANDFGDTNPPTPTMSGRGRGGSFGGRGGFGSNYNTDNSNSNVNNDMNTSSNGGLRGGRGGGRGGFQYVLEESIVTNVPNQTQSFVSSRGRGGAAFGGRGGFGTGANSTEVNIAAGGTRGGRSSFTSSSNNINSNAENNQSAQLSENANQGRPPPSRYVPVIRPVNEIFQEDIDHEQLYMDVFTKDEDVSISDDQNMNVIGGAAVVIDDWSQMGMDPRLYENVVTHSKYVRPRKIQSHVIPSAMHGHDMKVIAETGSGKTTAFMIPIIQKILGMPENERSETPPSAIIKPLALILVPTRELCLQVYEYGRKFADGLAIKVCKTYGEYSMGHNIAEIRRGCDILCATPGRLLHLARENIIDFTKIKFFVIDEADHMLENFMEPLTDILSMTGFPPNEERQTMLFSATFPPEVQAIAQQVLRPKYFFVSHNKQAVAANSRIEQRFVQVKSSQKTECLKEMLEKEIENAQKIDPANPKIMRTLVFVKTRRDADRLALYLGECDIKAGTINGDRNQKEREESLAKFRKGEVNVLVATDVCARGIDIKDCDHVFNYDLPSDERTYVHRIGRTGRLKEGLSTSFVDMDKDSNFIPTLVKLAVNAGQNVPEFMKHADDGNRNNDFGFGNVTEEQHGFGNVTEEQEDDGWNTFQN